MKRKSFAILGLGIFGSTMAKTLSEYGYDVIGIDQDSVNVDRVSEFATQAVQADFTDIDQLRAIGVQDVDVAVIATGSKLEASVMAVLHLKELGVPFILAKAKNKSLMSQNIIDMVDIDDDYSMMELSAPKDWVGKKLVNLDLRARFGVNVLGVRATENAKLDFGINADYIIHEEDTLLVIVENNKFEELEYQGKI